MKANKFRVILTSQKYTNPFTDRAIEIEVVFDAYDLESAKGTCEVFKLHGFEYKNLEEIKD